MSRDDESKRLSDLIDSVADGRSVDWDAAGAAPSDERIRRLLDVLRIVEGIADVHRSELAVSDRETAPRPPAATEASTIDADLPPVDSRFDRWGQFELRGKLGEGTFGEVYHAHDMFLNHPVALKLAKPIVDRKRFLDEAQTLANIRHPNVVVIHGAGQHGGRAGFWMDLIEGPTLAEVVEHEGVRSPAEAALIGRDLCRAMAAVHATGIVHRDIKAHNVIRQLQTGHIILMDFGAGEAMTADRAGRRPTGTPLYLAPELFDGRVATKESDIYALGVLLFHLVTRSYPVYGKTMDDLREAHRRGQRHHLGDMRPDLPDDFVRAVERMIDPDPAKRFHTATEAQKALEEVIAPAEPHPTVQESSKRGGLQRVYTWAGFIAFFLVGLTTMGFVSTAAFNATFGRSGFGSESPLQWFGWGVRLLVAPLVRLTVYVIVVLIVVAVVRLVCRLVPNFGRTVSTAAAACRRFVEAHELSDPALLLQITAGLGALAFGVLALSRWEDATIFAMFIDNSPSERLAALQPANWPHYDAFQRLLEFLLLVYGLVAYNVYLIARRAGVQIPSTTSTYVIAVPVVAVLLMRALPYRVVYQNDVFKRVDYGDTRCYEIGQQTPLVRLFCPDENPPRIRDYKENDPALKDRSIKESVFTPRNQAQMFNATSP